jgi:hypothetical protein
VHLLLPLVKAVMCWCPASLMVGGIVRDETVCRVGLLASMIAAMCAQL